MYQNFLKENPDAKASPSLYYRCKPFYISPANIREMEGCLCAKCLNPHSLYDCLRKHINNFPLSLTQYLTEGFECTEQRDINYPKLKCIECKCENGCKIRNESKKGYDWDKKVSYVFEKKTETYYNRQGKKKEYKRMARQDSHDVPLGDVYKLLQGCAKEYLQQRYHVSVDRVYWAKYLAETDKHVVWLDYSMNISLTPKLEVQSSHYSGKQHTLHDTLIHYPGTEDTYKYIYHLSDDTNHDSVMSCTIISDIIKHCPEVIQKGHLVLRSDNCSTQYKSRYVFQGLLDLTKKNKIQITWFFGEAGTVVV